MKSKEARWKSCTCQHYLIYIPYSGKFWRGEFWRILTFQIFNGKYFDGWSVSFTKCCIALKIWRVKFWQSGWKASKTSKFPPIKISHYTVMVSYSYHHNWVKYKILSLLWPILTGKINKSQSKDKSCTFY